MLSILYIYSQRKLVSGDLCNDCFLTAGSRCDVSHLLPRPSLTAATQVLGDNLLALIKALDYRGIPIPVVKRITWQARIAACLPVKHPVVLATIAGSAST